MSQMAQMAQIKIRFTAMVQEILFSICAPLRHLRFTRSVVQFPFESARPKDECRELSQKHGIEIDERFLLFPSFSRSGRAILVCG